MFTHSVPHLLQASWNAQEEGINALQVAQLIVPQHAHKAAVVHFQQRPAVHRDQFVLHDADQFSISLRG